MFRRGNIEDSQIAMIHNAASRLEADQIRELLEKEGIPVLLMDREDSGEYLRVLGFGSPFGVDVYVNRADAERAAALVDEMLSETEDISEEELTELAMKTPGEDL